MDSPHYRAVGGLTHARGGEQPLHGLPPAELPASLEHHPAKAHNHAGDLMATGQQVQENYDVTQTT